MGHFKTMHLQQNKPQMDHDVNLYNGTKYIKERMTFKNNCEVR